MTFIDGILTAICVIVCIISAVTDVKYQKIKNIIIFPTVAISVLLNTINSFITGTFIQFIINFSFVSLFGLCLYAIHFMGAGDSKLLSFIAASMPVYFYENRVRGYFGSIIILIYIFTVCMIYVIGESLILSTFFRNKGSPINKINPKKFFLSYIRGIVIVTAINEFFWIFLKDFYISNQYAVMILNFVIATKLPEIKLFSCTYFISALFVLDVVIAFITTYGLRFTGSDHRIIIIFLLFLLVRRFIIDRYNYKKIPTSEIEAGMILSTETTLLMTKSRVKGLPDISLLKIRSKLTSEEAESVRRWAKSKYGSKEILIVRHLPFGLFISIGTIIFIIESLVRLLCK